MATLPTMSIESKNEKEAEEKSSLWHTHKIIMTQNFIAATK